VPGAKQLFVGTPHAFDSIYDEQEEMGAECLTIPLFEYEKRIENAKKQTAFELGFKPVTVFIGIGKGMRMLRPFVDYSYTDTSITFAAPPKGLVDIYGECSWPDRFDRKELARRRKRCRTLGEWDSQYLLRSRPVHEVRLDPDRMKEYDCEIQYRTANHTTTAFLGQVQVTSMRTYWDVSTGKVNADASAFSVILEDMRGHMYWHDCIHCEGDIATFDEETGKIDGGQVMTIRDAVIKYRIPRVTVEVNGVGSFAGKLLIQALKGLGCAVVEVTVTSNKNARILEAFEGPITGGFMWAHSRVLNGPAYNQMRTFIATAKSQPDDFIDSGAGAILELPIIIGNREVPAVREVDTSWRGSSSTYEVSAEYSE
jgi:hypothetical protein